MRNVGPEAALQRAVDRLDAVRREIAKVIVGQDDVVEGVLICLLASGHVLLEGVPGLGKTTLLRTLARALQLKYSRIQFTPDLMPADIVGSMMIETGDRGAKSLRFQPGPIFANLVLADEINRATPKTQSALLEAMQERTVTSGTATHELDRPFLVMATQNPIEMEGTYPLPEAQLDRFLLKIRLNYPSDQEERQILERHHAGSGTGLLEDASIAPIPAGLLAAARAEVRAIRIEPELYAYILALARRTREWPTLLLGASPRAAVSVMRVAQAAAAFDGRDYLVPDDVKRAVQPVLRHRVILKPEAELEGFDADRVLADVLAAVPVPRQ